MPGRLEPAASPTEGPGDGEDRILTIPNALSLIRLACVPLFLYLLFGRDNRQGAAWLLAALGCSDWVDGYIARRFNQVSTLGKILDPAADRVLLAVGVFAILIDGSVPAWVAWLAIAREVAVGGGVLVLAAMGARRVDVQWLGKCGAFAMMIAFPLFLVSHAGVSWRGPARDVAWVMVSFGLVFGYWSAFRYIALGRSALQKGRVGSVG
jgi:cardiolipin synthase